MLLRRALKHRPSRFGFSQASSFNPLRDIIQEEIRMKGPMTFPSFWTKALLHDQYGYYTNREVFNKKGDFITSVEISQMFCELIAIWVINCLQQIKVINPDTMELNNRYHILEFGPGLGTLQCQIIRVLHQFKLLKNLQITFIESSDSMKKKQQENIVKQLQKCGIYVKYEYEEKNKSQVEKFTSEEVTLRWFKMYEHMLFEDFGDQMLKQHTISKNKVFQDAPVIMLAHEFFDALPIHIFQFDKTKGWCEMLVGLNPDDKINNPLAFQLSDGQTKNVQKVLNPEKRFSEETQKSVKDGDKIEICPQAAVLVNSVSELIKKQGGCGLIIDYGENFSFSDSVRAIANHQIGAKEDVLNKPGQCDLSAYVNFLALAEAAKQGGAKTYEIIPQGMWLESMGINARLEALCQNANLATEKLLRSEYDRLVRPENMGDIFKFFCISNSSVEAQLFPFIEETQQIFY